MASKKNEYTEIIYAALLTKRINILPRVAEGNSEKKGHACDMDQIRDLVLGRRPTASYCATKSKRNYQYVARVSTHKTADL